MNEIIKLYENHKQVLLVHHQQAMEELICIQGKELPMDAELASIVSEVLDYMANVMVCIDLVDVKIMDLKESIKELA